ncbi:hypothetical protein ABT025_35605 [Streptomyces sp. NPDC002809]|uniref:hypothetical protein n=1 Tax=Streptomyces sp. NPDC002809 TaxID=3154433 RepID=UPI0033247C44
MGQRDELLAAVRARRDRVAAAAEATGVLDTTALVEAQNLARYGAGGDICLNAAHALGWFHHYRALLLSPPGGSRGGPDSGQLVRTCPNARVQASILTIHLAPVIAGGTRTHITSESHLWHVLADRLGSEWRDHQQVVLAAGGEEPRESSAAAIELSEGLSELAEVIVECGIGAAGPRPVEAGSAPRDADGEGSRRSRAFSSAVTSSPVMCRARGLSPIRS